MYSITACQKEALYMGIQKRTISFLCAAVFTLLLCGCSAAAEKEPQSAEADNPAITITASFKHEDGTVLSSETVRFSDEENSVDYELDEKGELVITGLPREGELTVTVLDRQAQPQGAITLTFSQGSVIDAVTDGGGAGQITLKKETEEVALEFTLCDGGSLRCALQLNQSRIV